MEPILITDDMRNSKYYDGVTRKFGVTINGVDYLVKFPKKDNLSVYCEYIASNLMRLLGVDCHEVSIGYYKGQLVNVIRDFTSGTNFILHSFKDIKHSSVDTSLSGKDYTYDDVLHLLDAHLKMSAGTVEKAKNRFWDMFVCDALFANRDRHWGNWDI